MLRISKVFIIITIAYIQLIGRTQLLSWVFSKQLLMKKYDHPLENIVFWNISWLKIVCVNYNIIRLEFKIKISLITLVVQLSKI